MAPSKRRSTESASSPGEDDNAIASPSKRSRVESEDDEENEELEEIDQVEDEEDSMSRSSSSDPSARIKKKRGSSAEAGIIKEIYCENFMCHRKLCVPLCRNVNFIHGQNGSGKSAVLAAIQICLGAGARRTHRARNLKDLVRKDGGVTPSHAKIRVTLSNAGSDGYKPELYGETITVERTIALKGGYNGYKLLDENKKEVSRSKKDLDDMLDTLNIQVENPVAILDQEEAKKFITGKPEDKYHFFMQATELERINRSYAKSIDTLAELQHTNARIQESMQASVETVEKLKKQYKQHQEIGKLQTKLLSMKTQWTWAYFNSMDEEYNKYLQELEAFEEKAAKKREELTQAEAQSQSDPEQENSHQAKIEELLAEAQNQTALKNTLEQEFKTLAQPYKKAEHSIQQIQKRQRQAEKQLQAAQQRLQQARDEILQKAGNAESEAAQRTEALQNAEREFSDAKAQVDTLKQEQGRWLQKYEEIEPHVTDKRNQTNRLRQQVQGLQSTIHRLESSASDHSLDIWGPRVTKLSSLVENAKRQNQFRGNVIGPIGKYLRVVPGKEEYAAVAELALGNRVLDRFIVTNDHDSALLRQLRRSAGCQQDCGIFQVHPSSQPYNIPSPPAMDGIETVASVFQTDNALVFNCLVDNARMDQNAVARSKEIGEQQLLAKDGSSYRIRAENVKRVYCLPKGDQWEVRGGMFSIFSNSIKLKQTIGADRSAAIRDAKRELEQLEADLRRLEREEAKLNSEHSTAQLEWNKAKKASQANERRIEELREKIDAIKEEMEASANFTIDTTEYEEEVEQAREAIEKLKVTEQQLKAEMDDLKPKMDNVKARIDECTLRNEKIVQDMDKAQAEMTQYLESQTQIQHQIEKKRQKLIKYEECIKTHQDRIEKMKVTRDDCLLKARKMHFRLQQRMQAEEKNRKSNGNVENGEPGEEMVLSVEGDEEYKEPTDEELEAIDPLQTSKDRQYYQVRIDKLQKQLEQEKENRKVSREDPHVVFEKYIKAQKDLKAKTDQIEATKATIAAMQNDIGNRKRRWEQFRRHLSKVTDQKFGEMLTMNQYSGDLEFNHDNGQLELAVQKNSSHAPTETKDVKALSGGERSYTTICLLLALGESLETPFRIMDEFDVFLDAETRKLVLNSLVHLAKQLDNRQFIFITPQDVSGIPPDPKVRISKLNPPERHDVAGGLTQQTLDFASQ